MCLAIPGTIVTIAGDGAGLVATVEIAGTERETSLAMAPDAEVGDRVIVHSGVVLRVLDAAEAAASDELIVEALGR